MYLTDLLPRVGLVLEVTTARNLAIAGGSAAPTSGGRGSSSVSSPTSSPVPNDR